MRINRMTSDQREELRCEVTAISFWDEAYARNPNPTYVETTAWAARRRRVREILEQLEREERLSAVPNEFCTPYGKDL